MRLFDLIELMKGLDLGEPGRPRRPPHENLRAVQVALAKGLESPEFRLDCIEHDLNAWQAWGASGFEGMKPAMVLLPELGLYVRMFYWPPGLVSPPHEHTSWTMSAMFHNRLQVMTYDWQTALLARRLEKRSLFWAEPGRAGYIYDPAIHSPRNTCEKGAISFHIYNEDDEPTLERDGGPVEGLVTYGRPGTGVEARPREVFLTARENVYRLHAEAAMLLPCRRTMGALERLYLLGDPATRQLVARSMRALDAGGADAVIRRLDAEPAAPG